MAKHGSLTERVKNQCSHAKRDNTIFEYQTPSARRGKMEINGSSSSHLRKFVFSTLEKNVNVLINCFSIILVKVQARRDAS